MTACAVLSSPSSRVARSISSAGKEATPAAAWTNPATGALIRSPITETSSSPSSAPLSIFGLSIAYLTATFLASSKSSVGKVKLLPSGKLIVVLKIIS